MGWFEIKTIKQVLTGLGALLALCSAIYGAVKLIDYRIEEKMKDEEFVNRVAEKVRRPFVIFDVLDRDDRGVTYPYDSGGLKYIKNIEVDLKESGNRKIIVTTSGWLSLPPLMECLEEEIVFDVERGKDLTWVYQEAQWKQGSMWANTGGPKIKYRFRLEIIK